jgi:hypothetical protein
MHACPAANGTSSRSHNAATLRHHIHRFKGGKKERRHQFYRPLNTKNQLFRSRNEKNSIGHLHEHNEQEKSGAKEGGQRRVHKSRLHSTEGDIMQRRRGINNRTEGMT